MMYHEADTKELSKTLGMTPIALQRKIRQRIRAASGMIQGRNSYKYCIGLVYRSTMFSD